MQNTMFLGKNCEEEFLCFKYFENMEFLIVTDLAFSGSYNCTNVDVTILEFNFFYLIKI